MNRRTVLSTATAAAFGVQAPILFLAAEDDPVLFLVARWRQLGDEWTASLDEFGDETPESEALMGQRWSLAAEIGRTRPCSLEGIRELVAFVLESSCGDVGGEDERMALAAVVEALGGDAARRRQPQ